MTNGERPRQSAGASPCRRYSMAARSEPSSAGRAKRAANLPVTAEALRERTSTVTPIRKRKRGKASLGRGTCRLEDTPVDPPRCRSTTEKHVPVLIRDFPSSLRRRGPGHVTGVTQSSSRNLPRRHKYPLDVVRRYQHT